MENTEKKKKGYTEAQKRATYKYRESHRADYNENARNSYNNRMRNEEAREIHALRTGICHQEKKIKDDHINEMENMLIDLLKEEQQPNLVEQPKPNLNGDPNLDTK